MLNYSKSNDGLMIGALSCYHKKNNRYVFKHDDVAEPNDDELVELMKMKHGSKARYKKNIEKLENPNMSMLKLPKNTKCQFLPFQPVDRSNERRIYMVAGKSGSGKSTMVAEMTQFYDKIMNVFIVSPVKDDRYQGKHITNIDKLVEIDDDSYEEKKKMYDDAKIKFRYKKKILDLDPEDLMQMELSLSDMKPSKNHKKSFKLTSLFHDLTDTASFWVFDDNEACPSDKLEWLMNHLLLTGRHIDANMCVINHQLNNNMKTRNLINESHIYTIFPPMSRYIHYFLKEYLLFDTQMIKTINKLLKKSSTAKFGRVTIFKDEQIIMTEDKIITY